MCEHCRVGTPFFYRDARLSQLPAHRQVARGQANREGRAPQNHRARRVAAASNAGIMNRQFEFQYSRLKEESLGWETPCAGHSSDYLSLSLERERERERTRRRARSKLVFERFFPHTIGERERERDLGCALCYKLCESDPYQAQAGSVFPRTRGASRRGSQASLAASRVSRGILRVEFRDRLSMRRAFPGLSDDRERSNARAWKKKYAELF